MRCAACRARLVLPTPPGPAIVQILTGIGTGAATSLRINSHNSRSGAVRPVKSPTGAGTWNGRTRSAAGPVTSVAGGDGSWGGTGGGRTGGGGGGWGGTDGG